MEEELILGVGQAVHKTGPVNLTAPGSKDALKQSRTRNDGACQGGMKPTERAFLDQDHNNLSTKINKRVLDFNMK